MNRIGVHKHLLPKGTYSNQAPKSYDLSKIDSWLAHRLGDNMSALRAYVSEIASLPKRNRLFKCRESFLTKPFITFSMDVIIGETMRSHITDCMNDISETAKKNDILLLFPTQKFSTLGVGALDFCNKREILTIFEFTSKMNTDPHYHFCIPLVHLRSNSIFESEIDWVTKEFDLYSKTSNPNIIFDPSPYDLSDNDIVRLSKTAPIHLNLTDYWLARGEMLRVDSPLWGHIVESWMGRTPIVSAYQIAAIDSLWGNTFARGRNHSARSPYGFTHPGFIDYVSDFTALAEVVAETDLGIQSVTPIVDCAKRKFLID